MKPTNGAIVKAVAALGPWLGPVPSAYFVARSAMVHLAVPLTWAVVFAVVIEVIGLASGHIALTAYDWNVHKRKTDPGAPLWLAVALYAVYWLATFGLVVFLEIWPALAIYAPGIFPALAVVGVVNLALMSRQELREREVKAEKAEAKERRREQRERRRQALAQKAQEQESAEPEPETTEAPQERLSRAEFLSVHGSLEQYTNEEVSELAGVTVRTVRNWRRKEPRRVVRLREVGG